jgi:GAF domain-containing protein
MGARAEAFNAAQLEILELIATGTPLPDVLDRIVRLIEQQSSEMRCSILLLDPERRRTRAPLAQGVQQRARRVQIGPEVGSCGAAAFRGEEVVVEESRPIATGEISGSWRSPRASRRWSTPVVSPQRKSWRPLDVLSHAARADER